MSIGDKMKEDIKIAFFDLDGTLLNDNKDISKEDIETLNYLHDIDIKIVLASGRFDKIVSKYAQVLGCVDYLISNNGALMYDKQDNIIFKDVFNPTLLNKLWKYSLDNHIGLTLNTKGKRYSNKYATTTSSDNIIINKLINIEVYQLVFTSYNKDKITNLLNYLKDINVHITYISNVYYSDNNDQSISVDINLNHVSKGYTINYLLKKLHLKKDNAICFGDNINDQAMFNACKYSVIMNNAKEELKKKAKYITLDNNHSGITYFIKEYFKKKDN